MTQAKDAILQDLAREEQRLAALESTRDVARAWIECPRSELATASAPAAEILGVAATVERTDMTDDEQIVAICRRGRSRQAIPILDLPLPDPLPAGAEWIEACRHWARVV